MTNFKNLFGVIEIFNKQRVFMFLLNLKNLRNMDLREITAKDIMSTDVRVISPKEKVTTAELTMIKKNIGGLPVVADRSSELLGIITQRDIQISRAVIGTQAFHVEDLYSKNPVTAEEWEKLPNIIQKMQENNIERIPIIDKNKQVKGIVVVADIIRLLGDHFSS